MTWDGWVVRPRRAPEPGTLLAGCRLRLVLRPFANLLARCYNLKVAGKYAG